MSRIHNPAGSGFIKLKPGQHLSRKSCRICETPLDVHQAARGQLCDRLDRIDLQVEVPRPDAPVFYTQGARSESSLTVRQRVVAARNIQLERAGVPNALLGEQAFRIHCKLEPDGRDLLETASKKLALSPRACQRIMKVARTLADLEGVASIGIGQLDEAIAFRRVGVEVDTPLSRLNLH